MKFDQVVLHIGPPKTGSTAIQQVCNTNRSRLQDFDILYPPGDWHPQLGSFFCHRPRNFVYNVLAGRTDDDQTRQEDVSYLKDLTEQIEQTSCRKLILSYEGFIDLDVTSLYAMREFLDSLSNSIAVVAYARAPLDFACSEISQRTKFGLFRGHDVEIGFLPTDYVLAYKDFLSKFITIFGVENVIVRKFLRSEFPGGSVASDFLSFLGLQEDLAKSLDTATRTNASLSAEAVLIGAAISRADSTCRTPTEFMIRYLPPLERIRGTRITLTTHQAEIILSTAKEHLDWLLQNFGIEFEPESHLVDDLPRLFPQETIDSLARELLNSG